MDHILIDSKCFGVSVCTRVRGQDKDDTVETSSRYLLIKCQFVKDPVKICFC